MSKKQAKKKAPPWPPEVAVLGQLVERFHSLYKDQRGKRCVNAAAELFVYLSDRGFQCTAVHRNVTMQIPKANKKWLQEHAWVEIELNGQTYVADVTGPQQFRLVSPLWLKSDWPGALANIAEVEGVGLKDDPAYRTRGGR